MSEKLRGAGPLEQPVRPIALPVRLGFKYGSIKDANNRVIATGPESCCSDFSEQKWEQWIADAEIIIEALNRRA
jgi:hypothetical protein